MAEYTRERALDFWFEFDQAFLFDPSDEVKEAFRVAYPNGDLNGLVDLAKQHRNPEDLAAQIADRREGIVTIAEVQLRVMNGHFPESGNLQRAFEDFGQGTLLDSPDRRPSERLIHMMDGTPEDWVGYHRWHAFIKAAKGFGADADAWSRVNRIVALAWAIQSETDPVMDAPDNPGLPEARTALLRDKWMNLSDEALDQAFLSYTGDFRWPNLEGQVRAPVPEESDEPTSPSVSFSTVRALLEAANGNGEPRHSRKGRFWNLPLADLKIVEVHGVKVIETEGEGRGARSGLVRALRGALRGFPPMPLRRPPMKDEDIQTIEDWIDDGTPE